MLARLGFVASVLTENISTSRTCRLKNATPLRLRELIRENLDALGRVVDFLERRRILLYRITSNLIPFASHPVNRLRWWDEFADDFTALGRRFRALGIRVSTHPGSSPCSIRRARRSSRPPSPNSNTTRVCSTRSGPNPSAKSSCTSADCTPGARPSRWTASATPRRAAGARQAPAGRGERRPAVRRGRGAAGGAPDRRAGRVRLAAPSGKSLRAPLAEVLPAIFETWRAEDGRPKVHLSSQAAGGPAGAHADFIEPADALACFATLPPQPFDCMLEAKEKDRALLKLRADLRRRGIVERDVRTQPVRARG